MGDRVMTASVAVREIRWIGRLAYDVRLIAGNRDALPIRIRAGALDEGVPHRDLLVSPHHALFLDGVLIPAEHLVNGVSIVQEHDVESIEYFQVELDLHDVLIAEGAAAESFVDCDSRGLFVNAAEFFALYPEAELPQWQFCAERVEGGAMLERVRVRLAERAGIGVASSCGRLDGVLDQVGRVTVTGWAAAGDAPVGLKVLVDGMEMGSTVANLHRGDLTIAGIGNGRRGFQASLPRVLDGSRAHLVSVRRAKDNAELPGSPVLLPALPIAPALPGGSAAIGALLTAAERLCMQAGMRGRAGE